MKNILNTFLLVALVSVVSSCSGTPAKPFKSINEALAGTTWGGYGGSRYYTNAFDKKLTSVKTYKDGAFESTINITKNDGKCISGKNSELELTFCTSNDRVERTAVNSRGAFKATLSKVK
jgi:hypothetical protein